MSADGWNQASSWYGAAEADSCAVFRICMSRHDKKSCFLIEAIEAKFVCFFFVWINNKTCNKVLVFCFHHLSFRQFLIWKVKPALFQHLDQIFMVQSTMDPQTSHWTGDFWSNFGARSRRFAGHHLHWRCLGRCSYETCARGEVAVDGHSIVAWKYLLTGFSPGWFFSFS